MRQIELTRLLLTAGLMSIWCYLSHATPSQMSYDEVIVQRVKRTLLTLLGMKDPPQRGDRHVTIPPNMQRLYKEQIGNPLQMALNFKHPNTFQANTARSLPYLGMESPAAHIAILYFNISGMPADEDITFAELNLYDYSTVDGKNLRMDIAERSSSLVSSKEPISRTIDTKVISGGQWSAAVITVAVRRAIQRKDSSLAIELRMRQHRTERLSNHLRLKRESLNEQLWASQKPVLISYSVDVRHTRTKRAADKTKTVRKKTKRSECQRLPMKVDFKVVGWDDWIVAPNEYEAYYCHGECPFPLTEHMNATNHAIVQGLVNQINPETVPKPCCVPTELSPISMLYVSGETVVLKNYHDMVVESCGCR